MTWLGSDVTLKDSSQLNAFGRLKVSVNHTLFDSQQEYGLDTIHIWDATANGTLITGSSNASVSSAGNAVGPTSSSTRMTPITVSATNGHYAILQSKQYVRYIPGKSNISYITGIFAAGSAATVSIVLRSSTSGSVVDTSVAQSSWNQDKFDGTGLSGVTLDFTKVQILVIDAQMLYAGRVRIGFDVDGILHWAHYFTIANNQAVPTLQTYNLPIYIEGRTGASSTSFLFGRGDAANGIFLSTTRSSTGGTCQFICCSVQADSPEDRGFLRTANNGATAIAVTTRRPILSIRPKATYNSITNRAHIELLDFALLAKTNDALYEIVLNGTLTGAAFASVGTNSITEYDTSATAITGGTILYSGYASSGAGSVATLSKDTIDPRTPLTLSQIDALTATQNIITLVCTSLSGTSNITSAINWHEQAI